MKQRNSGLRCDMYQCYSSAKTIKLIILWDIFRVCLPIFLLVISLIVAINNSNESNDDNDIDSNVLTPSPGKGSSDINDQITVLSLLLGEILRASMICVMGIIAYCK